MVRLNRLDQYLPKKGLRFIFIYSEIVKLLTMNYVAKVKKDS